MDRTKVVSNQTLRLHKNNPSLDVGFRFTLRSGLALGRSVGDADRIDDMLRLSELSVTLGGTRKSQFPRTEH